MPISNTPNFAVAGMRAKVSGTPQWLLNDLSAACVSPIRPRQARSISLVPVLPTLPVTAMTRASGRKSRSRGTADVLKALQHVGHTHQCAVAGLLFVVSAKPGHTKRRS